MRGKSEQRFEIDGEPCVLRTKPSAPLSPRFTIELEVAGRPIESPDAPGDWESKKGA